MPKHIKPPHWYEVYEGNKEAKFFRVLARHPKYEWRGTSAIAREADLTKEEVETLILKYYYDGKNPNGMIFQSPTNEEQWGYWQRVPEMLPKDTRSIAEADKKRRIDKALEE